MYYKNRFCIVKYSVISLVVASNLYGAPSGGTVVSGNATINQSGNTTNINQSSNKAIINWQDFSIKSNETVNFNQPNVNSITLNRVIGNEKSIIDGALNANGQVWLINSNGVLFGKNAKVNTAGIVASTKDISNEDFNNGNYNFKGNSKASIVNEGEIKSLANTHATFIANSVTNKGKIEVHKGTINLVGASDVTLTLNENQNISLKVNKGVLDALVDNQNLLVANGGQIYLTTNAKDELLKGVVNNSGIIEANSLDELTQSEVILFAHGGTANISGEIKAKGGFVETSGKDLNVKNEAKITAKKWLLDPVNVTIDNQNGAIGSETVGASVIETSLNNNTNIEIQADNNINVNQNITWSTAQELTLNAGNNIYINKEITATNNAGKLALKYGQISVNGGSSDYYVNAKVNLKAGQNFSTQKGSDLANKKNYTVITSLGSAGSTTGADLQGINGNISANYVLGSDINASATSSWNGGEGFNPLGFGNYFERTFDGLGHTISDLYISRASTNFVGLFSYTEKAVIKNIGLENININGNYSVGGLVGYQNSGKIENSYASGTVSGDNHVGGLVGFNSGTISNSYASGTVSSKSDNVGGLVGFNFGTISNSYASGTVSGNSQVGGLVGLNYATITNSYYDRETNTNSMDDSSYGKTKAEILSSFSNVSGWGTTGGGASASGYEILLLPYLAGVTKDEYKSKSILFSGGFGTEINPYKITNWTQLQNINNSNILTKNYYFNLLNNINSSTTGYMGSSGEGWNPIGGSIGFRGTFDGKGFTISDLYINRPTQSDIGLFGYTSYATIKNIGLENLNISGKSSVGGLVGENYAKITNSYASGTVSGNSKVGGLVGLNYETITNSYASGTVNGTNSVGGLVGLNNYATITNSYALGSVNGAFNVGGLVGENYATITNSYASGTVSGNSQVGGLVGLNYATITNSFYDKTKNPNYDNGLGIGKTTAELEDIDTFKNASWSITADSTLAKGTPILRNGSWVIYVAPTPTPTPTPTDNNQKPKVDENVKRVVASIEPSTNSNSSSNQSVPNSLNSNIRTLSFNGVDETRIINGGVRVPDDIVNSLDEL
ncbi:GLUG motif-containing protein [Aliarcobacter cryaerophilus]|uniref:GLUG motif-containing protein n=1 Tax=Arcobacter sp. AZ-2023 TaxID=3074453 RepID=A0AA96DL08_9BACT|nr:GLUG motif-containing protein [Arcobacter sp. AZ-2023]